MSGEEIVRRSRLGEEGVDQFAEGADHVGVVGEDLHDPGPHGPAEAQPLGGEPAGQDERPGRSDLAQRKTTYGDLQKLIRNDLAILPLFQGFIAEGVKEGL